MRSACAAAGALLAAALSLRGGAAGAEDASWRPRADEIPVRYTIAAELVETGFGDGVRLVGDETVFWKNTSREPVKVLWLHTYANAFRNTRSTFLREGMRDGLDLPDDMRFSDMKVQSMTTIDGTALSPVWKSLDDDNPDDRTVLRVELPSAVESLAEIGLKISFTLELPSVLRRMGASHGFVMAAQWYPKLGMYLGRESKVRGVNADGWYCHQFHANTEFAADFANYDVTLRFPADYKVGATGVPQGADAMDVRTGTKVRQYKAESVVDFAWTAGRSFVEIEEDVKPVPPAGTDDPVAVEWRRVNALLGTRDEDAALPPVRVVLLVQPEHLDQAPRMIEAARTALGFFGTWLGPYPYPRLTVVDPPWNGEHAGGMEYPMLVTAGTVDGSTPESQRPEFVTVHEICHQWLMGILANNEAEEAWLDEGINTYLTSQAMDLRYGPAAVTTDVLGFHFPFAPVYEFPGVAAGWPELLDLPRWARPARIDAFRLWCDLPPLSFVPAKRYAADAVLPMRRSWMRRAGSDEMVKPGWTYADRTSYAVNAYSRPALFMSTLRRSLVPEFGPDEGERRFLRALRGYARDFRFRHPTTDDFLRKWKELAADAGPLADELVRTVATFDYAIESVRPADDPEFAGIDDKGTLHRPHQKDEASKGAAPKTKASVVRVTRRGDATVPVVVEARFADGRTERRVWDPKDQAHEGWRDFRFGAEVVAARTDPDAVWLQDLNLSNGTYAVETNARPAAKWSVRFLGWLENSMMSYGRFF